MHSYNATASCQVGGGDHFDSVVILSSFFWNFRDDMWQTTHHIAREWSRRLPVLYVEPPVQWNPRNFELGVCRLVQSLAGRRLRQVQEQLTIFQRRALPLGRSAGIREFDLLRNARALKASLVRFDFRRPLLWHTFPYWSEPLVDAVNPSLFVYHCLDHTVREEETRLIRRANATFCVSQTLTQKHRSINPRTYHLPNGVDIGLFNAEHARRLPRPSDLPNRGNILGVLGFVNYHMDVELLVKLAEAFPQDYVAVVGRVPPPSIAPQGKQKQALDVLRSKRNVLMLGFKPTVHLPAYIEAFDVCLIPFLDNPFNRGCDPLKFYQYMAMGKAVVSTSVTVAEQNAHLCYLSGSHEEFMVQVQRALAEAPSDPVHEQRVALAKAHSWDVVLNRACEILRSGSDISLSSSPEH